MINKIVEKIKAMIGKILIFVIVVFIMLFIMMLFGIIPRHSRKVYGNKTVSTKKTSFIEAKTTPATKATPATPATSTTSIYPRHSRMTSVNETTLIKNTNIVETKTISTASVYCIREDDTLIKEYRLLFEKGKDNKIFIGSSDECDIVIKNSKYINKTHAYFYTDTNEVYIVDNNNNGLFDINRNRTRKISLKNGTLFYLANLKFRYSKHAEVFTKNKIQFQMTDDHIIDLRRK